MPHIRAGYADLGLAPGKGQRTNDDIDNAMWLIWLLVIIGAAFGGIVDWPAKEVITPIIGPAGGRLTFSAIKFYSIGIGNWRRPRGRTKGAN